MGFFTNSPLEYPANQGKPVRQYKLDRAPTTNDFRNFSIGDEWLDTGTFLWYKMSDKTSTSGTWILFGGGSGTTPEFIPDSGTSPVIPDAMNQVTVTGSGGITTVGGAATLTIQLNGSVDLPLNFIPDSGLSPVNANGMFELVLAGGTNVETVGSANTITFNATGVASDFIPDAGTSPVVPNASGEVTLAGDGGIVTTGGLNSVTFGFTGGADVPLFFLPDSGTSPVVADASNQLTVAGGANVSVVGGLNTLTISATGFADDYIVDAGSSPVQPDAMGQLTITGGGGLITTTGSLNTITLDVAPVWASIHPDSGTNPVVASATNEVTVVGDGGITTVGSLNTLTIGVSGGGNIPLEFVVDGGTSPVTADAMNQITVTGAGGVVTNGSTNTITIQGSSGGLPWIEVTGTMASMAVNTGYIANNASQVNLLLPGTASVGDMIAVVGKGTGGWTITQNPGQSIAFLTETTTTTTGSITPNEDRAAIGILCTTANSDWTVLTGTGNFTVA